MEKTEIHFYEIGDKLYVKLKPYFWNVAKKIKNKNNDTWKTLQEKINAGPGFLNYLPTPTHPYGKEAIPLSSFKKLWTYLTRSKAMLQLRGVEKLIVEAKYGAGGKPIKNPKFPLDLLTPEWAAIEGAVRGDGSLYTNGVVKFAGKKKFVTCLIKIVRNALGDFDITPKPQHSIYRADFPELLGQVLIRGLKMKPGNKVKINPHLVKLYMGSDPRVNNLFAEENTIPPEKVTEIIKSELQWIFSSDGWVSTNRFIGLAFKAISKSNILKDVKLQLEKFGIKLDGPHYYRVKGGIWSRLEITSQKYIKLFKEKVGFLEIDEENNKKISKILETYQRPRFKKSENLHEITNAVLTLREKNKKITVPNLAKEMKWCIETARTRLNKLVDAFILHRIGGGELVRDNKGRILRCAPYDYDFINSH